MHGHVGIVTVPTPKKATGQLDEAGQLEDLRFGVGDLQVISWGLSGGLVGNSGFTH